MIEGHCFFGITDPAETCRGTECETCTGFDGERPAIRPDENPAGHVSCIVGMLAEPEDAAT